MTHDLLIHLPAPLDFAEVQQRLAQSELAENLSEQHSTPEQLVLVDEDTGVHAFLSPAPAELDEEDVEVEAEAEPPAALLLQIPYLRPRFFAEQGADWALAVARAVEGTIEDPQEKARGLAAEDIAASWERGNRALCEELEQPPEEGAPPQPEKPRPVKAEVLRAVYAHNRARRELREKLGAGVDVPGLVLAVLPGRLEPAVVCRFAAGEPCLLPDAATHVLLERLRKTWLGGRREEVLVEAGALREKLAKFAKGTIGGTVYDVGRAADDPIFQSIEGPSARGLAVMDWAGLVDSPSP